MIKVDASRLTPVTGKVLAVSKNIGKAAAIAIPAVLGADKFIPQTARKPESKKFDYQPCSDYCMEVLY